MLKIKFIPRYIGFIFVPGEDYVTNPSKKLDVIINKLTKIVIKNSLNLNDSNIWGGISICGGTISAGKDKNELWDIDNYIDVMNFPELINRIKSTGIINEDEMKCKFNTKKLKRLKKDQKNILHWAYEIAVDIDKLKRNII